MQERSVQGAEALNAVRLHVGGLGPAVLSSDLIQTFSSLVHVSSVDVVRSKERSFGYITIKAAPQDVKRLFSLYNGCMWKGGRLKLETAREFYMDKLRREWAEDDHPQDRNAIKPDSVSEVRKAPTLEKSSGLNLYFPKLRKIKKIPEKGLGRHKRSFERVEPLPHSQLMLCSCDQDCKAMCDHQSSVQKEAFARDNEESGQDIASARFKNPINKQMSGKQTELQESRNQLKRALDGKLNARDEITINKVTSACNDLFMNNNGWKPVAETFDAEGTIDEQLINVVGLNYRDGGDKNLKDQWLQDGKVQRNAVQRKRKKHEQCMFSEKKHGSHFCNIDKCKGQIVQGQDLIENKSSKRLVGKNWVQKAPWKSLVGGTGQMSFTLGSVLD